MGLELYLTPNRYHVNKIDLITSRCLTKEPALEDRTELDISAWIYTRVFSHVPLGLFSEIYNKIEGYGVK